MKESELVHLYGLGLLSGGDFLTLLNLARIEMRENAQYFRSKNWSLYDCVNIEADYRFKNKSDLERVFRALQISGALITPRRIRFSGFEGFCLLLRRLIYPFRLSDLAKEFYRDQSTLSSIIWIMTNWTYNHHGHLLKDLKQEWMNHQSLKIFGQAVWVKGAPVKNIWGFIDGTARPICRPSANQKFYFSGHKRNHCIKYQSIICPNGLIARLDGPYQGSRHDMFMLKHSNLICDIAQIATLPNRKYFVLYGDLGYVNSKYIMSPYRDARNSRQRAFNASMSSKRVSVEWGFGSVIKKFVYLDFKKTQQLLLQSLGKQYIMCTLFTNLLTCLLGNETSIYFEVEPPNLENYVNNN